MVKDLKTGKALMRGTHHNELYSYTLQAPRAFQASLSLSSPWHHILGHPSFKIMQHLKSSHHLPIKASDSDSTHAPHVNALKVTNYLFQTSICKVVNLSNLCNLMSGGQPQINLLMVSFTMSFLLITLQNMFSYTH